MGGAYFLLYNISITQIKQAFDKNINSERQNRRYEFIFYSAFLHIKKYIRCDGLAAYKNHICHKLSNLTIYGKL